MGRRSGNPAKRAWQPMERVLHNPLSPVVRAHEEGTTFYRYRLLMRSVDVQAWANNLYNGTLIVFDDGSAHFTFKRNDRSAIRDWRHIQAIKNEVVGYEREGFEIYPPESELVDGANEYHLWILPPGETLRYGFPGREVGAPHDTYDRQAQLQGAPTPGGKQRPWQEGLPTGGNIVRGSE